MPFHLEFPRVQYFFLPDPFEQRIRPYGFAGFGIVGQVNAGVPVAVCDNVDENGTRITGPGDSRCPENTVKRDNIEAYQVTGLNFVSFGAGGTFAITDLIGVNAELKMMVMLPTTGFVLAPSVAPVIMF